MKNIMNTNQLVAWGLIASIALAILNAVMFGESDNAYMLAGLGLMGFGIWAAVKLLKIKE